MPTLLFIVDHIDSYVRRFVPRSQPIVLLLDGHSSRTGIEWVRKAEQLNIILGILPAHTTHFLQPCDSDINKTFQTHIRRTRDHLLKLASTNVHSVAFKLKLAVAAHKRVSSVDVRSSFHKTGLWPLDFCFCQKFARIDDRLQSRMHAKIDRVNNTGPSHAARTTKVRHVDSETIEDLRNIFDSGDSPTAVLAEIQGVLNERCTVLDVLKSVRPPPVAKMPGLTKRVLACGAPSERLTVAKMLARRRTVEGAQRAAQDAKALKKAERPRKREEENARRAMEKQYRLEERERRKEDAMAKKQQSAAKKRVRGGAVGSNAPKKARTSVPFVESHACEAAQTLLAFESAEN